jgi:hypothetical protein
MPKVRATIDPIESPWPELKKFLEADFVSLIYDPRTDKYLVIAKKGEKTVRGIFLREWVRNADMKNSKLLERMEAFKKRLNSP